MIRMTGILGKTIKYYKERKEKKIEYHWISENPEVAKLSYYRKEEKQKVF